MKLRNSTFELESNISSTPSTFSIQQSSKAFKILSSALYSDKILAIVREIGCNALDAHISVGSQDVPFDVHIPTTWDPHFSVRDYGPGLSEDEIAGPLTVTDVLDETENPIVIRTGGIYNTYFLSTKTSSNDMVGALGLGSKSPFSYVDSFLVTSWHNGTQTIYNAFLNERGEPTISVMREIKSDEPNGIEVRVVVEPEDINTFVDKIKQVFQLFNVVPNLIGNTGDLKIPSISRSVDQDDWFIIDTCTKYGYHEGISYAVQGVVAYPINPSAIPDLSEDYKNLLSLGVMIRFDVGDLDIAPSREALSYDLDTVDAIERKLHVIKAYLTASVNCIRTNTPSKWNRSIDYKKTVPDLIKRYLNVDPALRKQMLHDSDNPYTYNPGTYSFMLSIIVYRMSDNTDRCVTVPHDIMKTFRTRKYRFSSGTAQVAKYATIKAHPAIMFIVDDLDSKQPKSSTAKVKRIIRALINDELRYDDSEAAVSPGAVYFISPDRDCVNYNSTEYSTNLKQFQDDLGSPNFIKASELLGKFNTASITKYTPTPREPNFRQLLVPEDSSWRRRRKNYSNGAYYVEFTNITARSLWYGDRELTSSNISIMARMFLMFHNDPNPVFAVTTKDEKLTKLSNVTEFFPLFERRFVANLKKLPTWVKLYLVLHDHISLTDCDNKDELNNWKYNLLFDGSGIIPNNQSEWFDILTANDPVIKNQYMHIQDCTRALRHTYSTNGRKLDSFADWMLSSRSTLQLFKIFNISLPLISTTKDFKNQQYSTFVNEIVGSYDHMVNNYPMLCYTGRLMTRQFNRYNCQMAVQQPCTAHYMSMCREYKKLKDQTPEGTVDVNIENQKSDQAAA